MNAADYNADHAHDHAALRALSWWPFAADATTSAGVAEIAAWQATHGLTADGALGPASWSKLREAYRPAWGRVPRGLTEILAKYGDPREAGVARAKWAEAHITHLTVRGKVVRNVHAALANEFAELLRCAIAISGYHPASIQTWNVRRKRGGDRDPATPPSWSTHSWAIAFDADPSLNPWGNVAGSPLVKLPLFAAVFRVAGWSCGLDWRTPDTMHFQACTGY